MKQTACNSQMHQVDANKSQTTQILYQPPTAKEQRGSRAESFKADIKDLGLFVVFAFVAWFIITCLLGWAFGV